MGLVTEIKDILRRERNKRGWSQMSVAASLGTGQSRYSGWETGTSEPRISSLQRVADLYDLDLVVEFREKVDERIAAMDGK